MEFDQWFQAAATVFLISMLPVLELKASIPLGLAMGLPLWETFFIAIIGCSIPVPFILFFMRPIFKWMKRFKIFKRFVEWFERHTEKKSASVRKYSLLGLFSFVAIPFPGTGVWTGSAIAAFLNLRIAYAFPVILLGNVVAGLLMLALGIIVI